MIGLVKLLQSYFARFLLFTTLPFRLKTKYL
jgi:hypothetical protein